MSTIAPSSQHNKTGKILFILSLACSAFWITSNYVNIYRYAMVGAIFEMLWLPMLALIFLLPLLCLIFMIKEKKYFQSYYLFTLILIGITMLILFVKSSNAG